MNEKNIVDLKTQLMRLGFHAAVEMELRCRVCFSPDDFELVHREISGADVSRFSVHVERSEKNVYALVYYQAVLRKEIAVPDELIAVDKKMSVVNWKAIASEQFDLLDTASVLNASELLAQIAGGDFDVLKFKHWVDTPLENLMANLAALRSRYEISERFYLLDAALAIPFAEANRFLQSKWMERQMVMSKKLLFKKTGNPRSAGVASGKLLTKNSRRSRRQGLLKKDK